METMPLWVEKRTFRNSSPLTGKVVAQEQVQVVKQEALKQPRGVRA